MKKTLFLIFGLLPFVLSCVKDPETHQLLLENSFTTLYADQTIDSVVFYTFDSWSVVSAADWLTIDGPSEGKIQYNNSRRYRCRAGLVVSPNTTEVTRVGKVHVNSYKYPGNFVRLQYGYLNISRPLCTVEEFMDEAQTVPKKVHHTLTVNAQTDEDSLCFVVQNYWSLAFEGETPEWLTLEKTQGERGKNSVKLSFSENTDATKTREAKLRLTSGQVSNLITIQQKPAVEE